MTHNGRIKEINPMEIKELFLPKLARSDPDVRKRAVRNESDLLRLRQVSKK